MYMQQRWVRAGRRRGVRNAGDSPDYMLSNEVQR